MELEIEQDRFYWDPITVPLNLPGITLFRGINHDTGKKNSSNGAGKSRLPQLIKSFIFDYADRGASVNLSRFKKFVGDDFKGRLTFKDHAGIVWTFCCDLGEWGIVKNGVAISISHKPSEVRALMQKILGFTRDEWGFFIHASMKSISTLLYGGPAERRDYLEQFFNIDAFYEEKYEEYYCLREQQAEELHRLELEQVKLSQINKILVEQESPGFLKLQIEAISSVLPHLKDVNFAESKRLHELDSAIVSWGEYHTLYQQLEGKPSFQQLDAQRSTLLVSQAQIVKQLENQKQLEELIDKEVQPLQKQVVTLPAAPKGDNPDPDFVRAKQDIFTKMQEKFKVKQRITMLKNELPILGSYSPMKEEVFVSIESELAALQNKVRLADKGDHCLECGQVLQFIQQATPEGLRKERDTLAEVLKTERALRIEYAKAQLLTRQIVELQQEFDQFPSFGTKLSLAQAEIQALITHSKEWQLWEKESSKMKDLESQLAVILAKAEALGYPEVLKLDLDEQLRASKQKIIELEREQGQVRRFDELTNWALSQKPEKTLQSERELVKLNIRDHSIKIDNLNQLKGDFNRTLELVTTQIKERDKILEELAKYHSVKQEFTILEALESFFSPKGFKLYELNERCKMLIERFNYWSPLFFQEPYEWSLSPDNKNLDFLIRPTKHKKTDPYSASLLSLGEENRGARVLLFGQLDLMPPKKKTNLLFLDEVETGLDKVGTDSFVTDVLPKIKDHFKDRNIVLISHIPAIQTSGTAEHLWLVDRKDRRCKFRSYPFYSRQQLAYAGTNQ